ncbi:MAG TPA: hypothetical protein DHW71_04120 [Gammaproteobacteria bacterium]|nr:hypothetical protein [Gammaproteobacteria bacterium]MEC8010605.1 AraC family transcriptional regulator ligand-binding domain-containing protein [Pseudomonadota bacterium]HBF07955.1 hypothetical protein [Gammaproteobacteria bacterium]HCK92147.1 hypothetical protein [Gammaproteobacteria bacterium]
MNQDIFCGFSGTSGSYLLALTKSAEKVYGISSDHLLQMTSLNPDSFGHEYHVVPVFYLANIISQLVNLTGDRMVGLKLAQHISLRAFDTLGYLLMHCETIGEGLQRIQRFEKLVMEHSVTQIESADGLTQVSWNFDYNNDCVRYFRELIISGWVSMVQRMTQHKLPLHSIHFSHSNPWENTEKEQSALEEYEAIYGCPVVFNSTWTGACFEEQYMSLSYGQADPRLKAIMEEYAELMLSNLDSHQSFIHHAKVTIFKQLLNGETGFDSFAELMHLSTRALQARFQKLGVTYGDLLDEIRRMLSLIYLEDTGISSLEIGMLLAYNDQSSFARAFKRWTGHTPKQYKEKVEQHRSYYAQMHLEDEDELQTAKI